jgi:hypothetical protein
MRMTVIVINPSSSTFMDLEHQPVTPIINFEMVNYFVMRINLLMGKLTHHKFCHKAIQEKLNETF